MSSAPSTQKYARIEAGLIRAKSHGTKSGKPFGRPRVVFRHELVTELREKGHSWAEIARRTGVSTGTVRRAYQSTIDATLPCQNPAEMHSVNEVGKNQLPN